MLTILKNHRSIRKYKSTSIPEGVLQEILAAAIQASNTGSMQVYSIIVTQDKTMKTKLWEQHFKQPMVQQAPLLLTFCADFNRFTKWCESRNAKPGYTNFLSFFTANIDANIVAQNAAIAAETLGLGICYLGTTNYNTQKIIDILKLPKGVVPITTLVVGYPDEAPELTPRLPNKAVIHYETYQNFTEEDINDIYNELENNETTKELIAENKTENLAQIFTQKRYTTENNNLFSETLLEAIKKQGFL